MIQGVQEILVLASGRDHVDSVEDGFDVDQSVEEVPREVLVVQRKRGELVEDTDTAVRKGVFLH